MNSAISALKDIIVITNHRHDFIKKELYYMQTLEDVLDHKQDGKSYCYDTISVDVLC